MGLYLDLFIQIQQFKQIFSGQITAIFSFYIESIDDVTHVIYTKAKSNLDKQKSNFNQEENPEKEKKYKNKAKRNKNKLYAII